MSSVRDDSFSVPMVLDVWQVSSDCAEVLQNPWAGAAKEGDIFEHYELVLIVFFLEVFSPDGVWVASVSETRAAAEFADD